MGLRITIMVLALTFSSMSSAYSLFCANTSRYVDDGADQAAVVAACGQPISKTKKTIEVTQPVRIVNYIYRFDQGSTAAPTRPPIILSFANGQVTSIIVGGEKLANTSSCDKYGNQSVSLGMNTAQVTQVCGNMPDQISGEDSQQVVGKKTIEVWTYQFSPQGPLTELHFEDGKLTGPSQ